MSENDNRQQRYSGVGSAFLGKVARRLQSLKVEELSAADTARWTEVAIKLEQASQFRRASPNRREQYLEKITQSPFEVVGEGAVDLEEYDEEGSSDDQ